MITLKLNWSETKWLLKLLKAQIGPEAESILLKLEDAQEAQ
jgi:hypothetical protein